MNLLPIVKQVAAKTIDLNLVNVKPMCGLTLEQEKEREREIRRRKLQVLMGNAKFNDFGDLPYEDEINIPSANIFYLDYTYNSSSSKKATE